MPRYRAHRAVLGAAVVAVSLALVAPVSIAAEQAALENLAREVADRMVHQVALTLRGFDYHTRWDAGMVPFWESSSNDTPEGTTLGNESAVTSHNAMGFSPEIEPEGDGLSAFRMAHAARDFAPDHPMIYLGWPPDELTARLQLATALASTGKGEQALEQFGRRHGGDVLRLTRQVVKE